MQRWNFPLIMAQPVPETYSAPVFALRFFWLEDVKVRPEANEKSIIQVSIIILGIFIVQISGRQYIGELLVSVNRDIAFRTEDILIYKIVDRPHYFKTNIDLKRYPKCILAPGK
jgi:hypothetical protein